MRGTVMFSTTNSLTSPTSTITLVTACMRALWVVTLATLTLSIARLFPPLSARTNLNLSARKSPLVSAQVHRQQQQSGTAQSCQSQNTQTPRTPAHPAALPRPGPATDCRCGPAPPPPSLPGTTPDKPQKILLMNKSVI
eukprot:GFUD01056902.1.p1 GENE.GFUD01056902.1~~GFUD01056902.1.p1  ORF type:complete len:139 (+),score=42.37 GFUD01056902.1:2-418(+)